MPQVLSSFKSVNVAAHIGKREEDKRVVTVIPYNEHLAKAVECAHMPLQNKNILVKHWKTSCYAYLDGVGHLPGTGYLGRREEIFGSTYGLPCLDGYSGMGNKDAKHQG